MRFLFSVLLAGLTATLMSAGFAAASDVEVKGPHICCGSCVKAVGKLLANVDGVTGVKADIETKTVSFTASSSSAAKAGIKALVDGGFYGKATEDGKEIKIEAPGATGKADSVTVKNVHGCCGMCHKAIKGLFSNAKVTIQGEGPQRTVLIEGTNIDRGGVLEALRKKGFNGSIEK
jgi:periplasmic mercuric ion binding protein